MTAEWRKEAGRMNKDQSMNSPCVGKYLELNFISNRFAGQPEETLKKKKDGADRF